MRCLSTGLLLLALSVAGLSVPFAAGASYFPSPASPDGSKVLFLSERDNHHPTDDYVFPTNEVYVANTDGSGVKDLSNDVNEDNDASWSPDGSKVVFVSERNGNKDIYVVNVDGSGLTKVSTSTADDQNPQWSPDGNKVAFMSHRDDGDYELYVVSPDGSGLIDVSAGSMRGVFDWQSTSSRLAFVSERSGNSEIYSVKVDGSMLTNISSSDANDITPVWIPGTPSIVFSSERDGTYDIYKANFGGGGLTRLTNGEADEFAPHPSPDGDQIAYTRDDGVERIYSIDSDGSNEIALSDGASSHNASFGGWSPAGDRALIDEERNILISSGVSGEGIYTVSSDGSGLNKIHSAEDFAGDCAGRTADIRWSTVTERLIGQIGTEFWYDIFQLDMNGASLGNISNNSSGVLKSSGDDILSDSTAGSWSECQSCACDPPYEPVYPTPTTNPPSTSPDERPSSEISVYAGKGWLSPKKSVRRKDVIKFGGTADDDRGVAKTQIALVRLRYKAKGQTKATVAKAQKPACEWRRADGTFKKVKSKNGKCKVSASRFHSAKTSKFNSNSKYKTRWSNSKYQKSWSVKLKHSLRPGTYVLYSRAIDTTGQVEQSFNDGHTDTRSKTTSHNILKFKIK